MLFADRGAGTNQIIRYTVDMRTLPATSASRGFSELLDAVERGDSVTITRGGRPVAVVSPVPRYTLKLFVDNVAGSAPLDEAFATDIAEAVDLLEPEAGDPWAVD